MVYVITNKNGGYLSAIHKDAKCIKDIIVYNQKPLVFKDKDDADSFIACFYNIVTNNAYKYNRQEHGSANRLVKIMLSWEVERL